MTIEPHIIMDIYRAWMEPGAHPQYHHNWQRRLLAEWPTLAHAVQNLCKHIFQEGPSLPQVRQEYDN